jgi:energy-coupling factor transporter ATP-binding protein EcfA2
LIKYPITEIKGKQLKKKLFGEVTAIDGLNPSISEGEVYVDIYGMSRVDSNKRIYELLSKFELFDKKGLVIKGFSTGMKRKVALIRAMLHRPQILLLDEPTNGLDPVSTTDLRNMLSELAKEYGTTIIMTTHNLDEVQKMCDKISIFRHGQNIFTDSISALKDSNHYAENGQFSLEKLYMDIKKKGQRMGDSILVFHNQFAQFKQEKGMLFFYCLSIVIMGIVVPIFIQGIESSLTFVAYLAVIVIVDFVPVLAIVYLTNNILMWSLIYSVALLACNAICIWSISDKITHPQIVGRL